MCCVWSSGESSWLERRPGEPLASWCVLSALRPGEKTCEWPCMEKRRHLRTEPWRTPQCGDLADGEETAEETKKEQPIWWGENEVGLRSW